ncbi:hypothetical protein ACSSO1_000123 [Enterococcus hirae]
MPWWVKGVSVPKENKLSTETNNKKFIRLMQKQKKKRGQYQKKLAPKRNVQDLLRYEKMFESGICEIVPNYYAKSVRFSDVNYQIAQQDEQLLIFQRYGELLNSLDDTIHLTITILKKELSLMR